jgi:hypothetical protein
MLITWLSFTISNIQVGGWEAIILGNCRATWMVPGGARQDLSKKMEIFIRFVELGWTGKSACYLFAVLMVGRSFP